MKNTADGKSDIRSEYTKAGTYKYTIVETNAGQTIDGVIYDSLEVKVTVVKTMVKEIYCQRNLSS